MAELVVTLTADEANLFRAMQKLTKQQENFGAGYDDVGKRGKKAADDIADAHVKAFKQTQDAAKKVNESYKTQLVSLDAQVMSIKKGKAAAAEFLAVQSGMTKEQAASIRLRHEELDALQKSKAGHKDLGKTSKDSLNLSQYTSAASGVGLITMAVGAATTAWREYKASQKDALGSLQQNADADRRLTQVATSGEDLANLQKESDDAAKISGVDRQTARAVRFTARSEGFDPAFNDIMKAAPVVNPESAAGVAGQLPTLFKKEGVSPLQAVSRVLVGAESSRLNFEQVAEALPQAAEGASMAGATLPETIAATTVLASKFQSGSVAANRIKAFTTAVAIDKGSVDEDYDSKLEKEKERAANAAKQLRTKEERVSDIQKRLMDPTIKPQAKETIETQLARAQREVSEFNREDLKVVEPKRSKPNRPSLAGLGVVRATEALMAMPDETRNDFLKENAELNTAYNTLKDELPLIKARQALIEKDNAATAKGGGLLREKTQTALANPAIASRIKVNASSIEATIAQETELAKGGAKSEVATNKLQTAVNNRGLNPFERFTANRLSGVNDLAVGMGVNETTAAETTAAAAENIVGIAAPELQRGRVSRVLRRQQEGAGAQPQMAPVVNEDQKRQAEALEKQNAMMAEQTKIMTETAKHLAKIANGGGVGQTPNPAGAIRAQIAKPLVLGAN